MRWLLRFVDDPDAGPLRVTLLRRAVGLAGLLLVAVTWRLWTPQTVFPQVPWFAPAGDLPQWMEWIGCAGMIAGLAGAVGAPDGRWARTSLLVFAASTAGMIVVDQGRLQPWAYQFVLVALVLAWAQPREAAALLRLFIVSFYFHSALTKLDFAFLHTLGQQFLAALAGTGGLSPAGWSEPARLAAAAAFPIGEMMVAVGLFFGRSRRAALYGAIALHGLLLLILGPWGLDHKPGVLVWNMYFIVQDVLLFWMARRAAEPSRPATARPLALSAIVGAAMVLPFLEPTAWFDLWPSWGLYAASAEYVQLQVHRSQQQRLAGTLGDYLEEPADPHDPWLTVRIDRWALNARAAPIYPQNRVQLGVARAVAARYDLGNRVRAIRYGLAARFTGQRNYAVFRGPAQFEAAGDEYFFSARPRRNWK